MRPIIYPYKLGSQSAKALAEELKKRGHKALRVRPDGKYKYFSNHLIINWGNSHLPMWQANTVNQLWLNHPAKVALASNKLTAFQAMGEAGVSIPEFTTDEAEALNWCKNNITVVGRAVLRGHSGEGIWINTHENTFYPNGSVAFPMVPLYVKYIKKTTEYRVHVVNGKVIDVQEKRKRKEVEVEDVDYKVRNHSNGWVYCRSDVSPHKSVLDNALAAINALGLDFGGVDVIWNQHYDTAFVLEVNTAVGLEGTTVELYANAIEEML